VTPSKFREDLDTYKTRMNGLSCGEESMTICSAVLKQYQTDGRVDVLPIAKTCFSIADACKNNKNLAIANRSRISCINTNNNDLEIWFRGHSMSLKVVPFKSLVAVSYSPSVVTMAVSVAICDIFSVKEWPDLETGLGFVQGHWK